MSVNEYSGILTYKDKDGNLNRMYPVTKRECLQDMDEIDAHVESKNNPHAVTALQTGAVPNTRKINGVVLNGDINLTPANLGIRLDKTLSTSGYYAEAKATGDAIAKKAETAVYTGTFLSKNWSSSTPYTQTITVTNKTNTSDKITQSDIPFIDIDLSSASNVSEITRDWAMVGRVTTGNNTITAYCYDGKPEVNLPVMLRVIR